MNARVKARMYNKDFSIIVGSNFNSKGDPTTTTEETFKGYLVEKIKTVLNEEGKEETSRAQIFLNGTDIIKYNTSCKVSYDTISNRRIVKIDVYRLPNNEPDFGVIYLT